MRALALALFVLGCAPQQAHRPIAETPTPQALRIVSWNMEHLAERDGSGCRPRTEDEYRQLRALAQSLNADIVAFQEVESARAAARVFDPAEYEIVIEERAGSGTRRACYGMPGQVLNRQATGFAIRRGIPFTRAPDVTALSLGDEDLRSAVDIIVVPRDGFAPLRLLSVHMKSGCASGATNEACAILQRQAPILETWIDARANEGLSFIVLGDFNRRLAQPNDALWNEWDDGAPVNADLSLADAGIAPRCDPRYRDFIDHFILDRRATARTSGFDEIVYRDARLSDHCPIAINVSAH